MLNKRMKNGKSIYFVIYLLNQKGTLSFCVK